MLLYNNNDQLSSTKMTTPPKKKHTDLDEMIKTGGEKGAGKSTMV
jgi:hypothetical protein